MPDRLTAEQRRFNMSRIRGRDTKPEMIVRRLLHRLGYRFRLHRKDLPGRPDIVLPKWQTVIFVHGCFWHGHQCDLFRWPATHSAFWKAKIARTVQRDRVAEETLGQIGWRVLVVWECALKGPQRADVETLATVIEQALLSTEPIIQIAPAGAPGSSRGSADWSAGNPGKEWIHARHG